MEEATGKKTACRSLIYEGRRLRIMTGEVVTNDDRRYGHPTANHIDNVRLVNQTIDVNIRATM